MKLYLATSNLHKVQEISLLLKESTLSIEVLPAQAIGGMPIVHETESTFEGNARLKANALLQNAPSGSFVLAEDSGLEVDTLEGKPGIYSSRFTGENACDEDNNSALLEQMKEVPPPNRSARFICSIVVLNNKGLEQVFTEKCEGKISHKLLGKEGFGYDPLFIPTGYEKTFGELGAVIKNKISHRSKAIRRMIAWLLTLSDKQKA
jgi:XTP/dITP diphosphohydrolase